MAQAPCRTCRSSSSGDNEVFACGARSTPTRVHQAAMAEALCSRASTESVATGLAVSPAETTQPASATAVSVSRTPSGIPLWCNPSTTQLISPPALSR